MAPQAGRTPVHFLDRGTADACRGTLHAALYTSLARHQVTLPYKPRGEGTCIRAATLRGRGTVTRLGSTPRFPVPPPKTAGSAVLPVLHINSGAPCATQLRSFPRAEAMTSDAANSFSETAPPPTNGSPRLPSPAKRNVVPHWRTHLPIRLESSRVEPSFGPSADSEFQPCPSDGDATSTATGTEGQGSIVFVKRRKKSPSRERVNCGNLEPRAAYSFSSRLNCFLPRARDLSYCAVMRRERRPTPHIPGAKPHGAGGSPACKTR